MSPEDPPILPPSTPDETPSDLAADVKAWEEAKGYMKARQDFEAGTGPASARGPVIEIVGAPESTANLSYEERSARLNENDKKALDQIHQKLMGQIRDKPLNTEGASAPENKAQSSATLESRGLAPIEGESARTHNEQIEVTPLSNERVVPHQETAEEAETRERLEGIRQRNRERAEQAAPRNENRNGANRNGGQPRETPTNKTKWENLSTKQKIAKGVAAGGFALGVGYLGFSAGGFLASELGFAAPALATNVGVGIGLGFLGAWAGTAFFDYLGIQLLRSLKDDWRSLVGSFSPFSAIKLGSGGGATAPRRPRAGGGGTGGGGGH